MKTEVLNIRGGCKWQQKHFQGKQEQAVEFNGFMFCLIDAFI